MGRTVSCLVNTRTCHKTKLIIDEDMIPKYDKLNIGVIISGPSGLAFAITAARVVHRVTLYDKEKEIGRNFKMARRIQAKD